MLCFNKKSSKTKQLINSVIERTLTYNLMKMILTNILNAFMTKKNLKVPVLCYVKMCVYTSFIIQKSSKFFIKKRLKRVHYKCLERILALA